MDVITYSGWNFKLILVRKRCPWWHDITEYTITWWRHQMETFSALLAICAGNSPVTGELPTQRPVTRSFDVFFDLRPNKRLSQQSWGWWFQTSSCSLWCHCNAQLTHKYSTYQEIWTVLTLGCVLFCSGSGLLLLHWSYPNTEIAPMTQPWIILVNQSH